MKFLTPKLPAMLSITALCIVAFTTTACKRPKPNDPSTPNDVSAHEKTAATETVTNDESPNVNNTAQSDNDDNNDDLEATIREFATTQSQAESHYYCHVSMNCPDNDATRVRQMSRYQTYEKCNELGEWNKAPQDLNYTIAAIKAGRLKFDVDKAAECLQVLKQGADDCNLAGLDQNTLAYPGKTPCNEVFIPLQADGNACFKSNECISKYCHASKEKCALSTCAFTATIPPPSLAKKGKSCREKECAAGLFCNYGDPDIPYWEMEEVEKKDKTIRTCQPLTTKNNGETCHDYLGEVCAKGLVCYNDICSPPPTFGPLGADCDSQSDHCKIGLTCRTTDDNHNKTCVPHSKLDELCDEHVNCHLGLWCNIDDDASTGKCVSKRQPGEPCTDNDSCINDNCEDYEDGHALANPVCSTFVDTPDEDNLKCQPI